MAWTLQRLHEGKQYRRKGKPRLPHISKPVVEIWPTMLWLLPQNLVPPKLHLMMPWGIIAHSLEHCGMSLVASGVTGMSEGNSGGP